MLGDDALGFKVVEKLKKMRLPEGIKVECCSSAPFSVARRMLNFRRVIMIDSLQLPHVGEGEVARLRLNELCDSPILVNPHGASLPAALEVYRALYPDQVPEEVLVIGVGVGPPSAGEGLSEGVEARVDEVVDLALTEIGGGGSG